MFDYGTTLAASGTSATQQISLGLGQRNVAFLQELVGRYQYRLVRYLIYLLGRRDEVDDLVQETWLRVLERGSSYDGRSRFEPWLFTIARNLAIDQTRKRWKCGATPCDSHDPSPFTLAARNDDAQRLALSMET